MLRSCKGWYRACRQCGKLFKATNASTGKQKALTRNGLKGQAKKLCRKCYNRSVKKRIAKMKETYKGKIPFDMRKYNIGKFINKKKNDEKGQVVV